MPGGVAGAQPIMAAPYADAAGTAQERLLPVSFSYLAHSWSSLSA